MRNPLNGALLQLELLLRANGARGDDTPHARAIAEAGDVIKRELRGLSSLLDEFLQLARAPIPRLEPVDVVELARDLARAQAPVAEAIGVRLTLSGAERCSVMAEASKLRQALLNLLRNAFEAMPDGGSVTVHVGSPKEGDDHVEIIVDDEGPGFSTEMLEDALRPFRTDKPTGTGLGLSIVARTLRAMGGRVTLGNTLRGARVALTIPLATDD